MEHQSLPWTLSEFSSASEWDLSTTDDLHQVPRNPYSSLPPPLYGKPFQHQGIGPVVPGSRARVPRCECFECKLVDSTKGATISLTFSDYDTLDPSQVKGLSEHQALLCMSHMFGFILKDRTYGMYSSCFLALARVDSRRHSRCKQSKRAHSCRKCNRRARYAPREEQRDD